ncbi:MAG TPA: carbon-nitrogen hydrolase family protein [Acidimicrobiales bacterium]|nr:carbon-nitrogen hydrolase family protein [Acidimicrobiales bacterium]
MKRDLLVGVAQWLATPGDPAHNLNVARSLIEQAAAKDVELLVLPELWSCGYDPDTLATDARQAAEPLHGPRTESLSKAARAGNLWLVAGSVPELGDDGNLYNTAIVFNPAGEVVAWHRKAHLYCPTSEQNVFTPGDRLTTFDDPSLGTIGVVICFDGDFPEVARTLALRGARLVVAPSAYEVEGADAWDILYPAIALTNSQWWVQANQCGAHGTSTLLGASRILAPTGTVVAEASRALPGCTNPPELLIHRVDLHLAHQHDGIGALLEEDRRPELYFTEAVAPERR